MIAGTITLEDLTITFGPGSFAGTTRYTVGSSVTGTSATIECPQAEFFAALSISVHTDGKPNAERDYPIAESIQPESRELRWIP